MTPNLAKALLQFQADPPHIVAYKKPRSVDIVADLPKNVSDQSRKRELRERY